MRITFAALAVVLTTGPALSANLFEPYIGEYKVVSQDCMTRNSDGSCQDLPIPEISITGDRKRAQIEFISVDGYRMPYHDQGILDNGTWEDFGVPMHSEWRHQGIRLIHQYTWHFWDKTSYAATVSLQKTPGGLILTKSRTSVTEFGQPTVEIVSGRFQIRKK